MFADYIYSLLFFEKKNVFLNKADKLCIITMSRSKRLRHQKNIYESEELHSRYYLYTKIKLVLNFKPKK